MEPILYTRTKTLCDEFGITIQKLEIAIGVGNASINKWKKGTSPSVETVVRVAQYFNVSTDYLLGLTDIRIPVENAFRNDSEIITIQRARESMPPEERRKMMRLLGVAFEKAFQQSLDEKTEAGETEHGSDDTLTN